MKSLSEDLRAVSLSILVQDLISEFISQNAGQVGTHFLKLAQLVVLVEGQKNSDYEWISEEKFDEVVYYGVMNLTLIYKEEPAQLDYLKALMLSFSKEDTMFSSYFLVFICQKFKQITEDHSWESTADTLGYLKRIYQDLVTRNGAYEFTPILAKDLEQLETHLELDLLNLCLCYTPVLFNEAVVD